MKELYKISELPLASLLSSDFFIISSNLRSNICRANNLVSELIQTTNSPTIRWTVNKTFPISIRADLSESFIGDTNTIRLLLDTSSGTNTIVAHNFNLGTANSDSIIVNKSINQDGLSYNLSLELINPVSPKNGGLGISTTPFNNSILIGNDPTRYSLYNLSSGLKIGRNSLTINSINEPNSLIVSIDPLGGLDLNGSREIKIKDRLTFINSTTEINVIIDGSGSMDDTRPFINTAINSFFKNIVKEFYNNDSALVDNMTRVKTQTTDIEFYLRDLRTVGRNASTTRVVNIYIGDEVSAHYTGGPNDAETFVLTPFTTPGTAFNTDMANLRNTMSIYGDNYFRCIVLHLQYKYNTANNRVSQNMRNQLYYIKNGLGLYAGANGLSDKKNFDFIGDIPKLQPPSYYAKIIKDVLVEL